MIAYELYSYDQTNGYEYLGMLPERRKKPDRITRQSVVQWGKVLLGDRAENRNIFFKQVAVDRETGEVYWVNF